MRFFGRSNKTLAIMVMSGLCLPLLAGTGYAGEDAQLYVRARNSGRNGHVDFAFMNYRSLLRGYPRSKFKKHAVFAHGEYYFLMANYSKSESMFNRFIRSYPDTRGQLFAKAYLLRIAREKNDEEMVETLRKQIITFRQIGLVFRDFKKYNFQSPLSRGLKAIFYIDKIEFYAEGELFEEISY